MALRLVERELLKLGGTPKLREGFVTDNGNLILDVSGLKITDPVAFESELDHLTGTVTNGLFARRRADIALISSADGVRTLRA
jgi:ribose 5-phosphate isomerase A